MATVTSIESDNYVERLGSCTSGLAQFRMRLSVADLEFGMRVDELDKPWLESSFLFQGFFIETEAQLAALRQECKYVYVLVTREVSAKAKKLCKQSTIAAIFDWTGTQINRNG